MAKAKKLFEYYKEVVFSTNIDLHFWKSSTDKSIEEYIAAHGANKLLVEAMFAVNDINSIEEKKLPDIHKEIISISTSNLQARRQHLYYWMINLSLLKIYNALEIFILRSIQLKYFTDLDDPLSSRNACKDLEKSIITELKNHDIKINTKNNKHLIDFISLKSESFIAFTKQPIKIDLKTNWFNFFELISILRNIIVHNGMLITIDIENEIKSKAKDIFERHFNLIDFKGMPLLIPIEDNIRDFMHLYNDFSLNTVKLIFEEKDFTFFGMETPSY